MIPGEREPPSGAERVSPVGLALVVLAGLGAALYTYRPWQELPLDVWDYKDFIPLLRAGGSALEQFGDLLSYYAGQGRQSVMIYAGLVAQWHLFGDASAGWQWVRFGVMTLNLVLLWVLFRRLGMSWFGAAAGAGLFLGASPATRGWVRLMSEPQALGAFLLAAIAALGYQSTPRWGRRAALIVALLAFIIYSKEVIGVLAPALVLLAWSWRPGGGFGPVRINRRNAWLGAAILVLAVLSAALLFAGRNHSVAVGYGMGYGSGAVTFTHFTDNLIATLLPFRTIGEVSRGLLYPANLFFILVVALGWVNILRDAPNRGDLLRLLGWIALIPVLGAAVYLPWPKFDSFYALPFFLSSGILLGCAVTVLERQGRVRAVLSRSAVALIVFYLALASRRSIVTAIASLHLNVAVSRDLATFRSYDSVVVVGPKVVPVRGEDLRAYAIAMQFSGDGRLPPVRDLSCEDGLALLTRGLGRTVLVTYSYGCGLVPVPTRRLRQAFVYRDWVTLAPIRDSLMVDYLVGR